MGNQYFNSRGKYNKQIWTLCFFGFNWLPMKTLMFLIITFVWASWWDDVLRCLFFREEKCRDVACRIHVPPVKKCSYGCSAHKRAKRWGSNLACIPSYRSYKMISKFFTHILTQSRARHKHMWIRSQRRKGCSLIWFRQNQRSKDRGLSYPNRRSSCPWRDPCLCGG